LLTGTAAEFQLRVQTSLNLNLNLGAMKSPVRGAPCQGPCAIQCPAVGNMPKTQHHAMKNNQKNNLKCKKPDNLKCERCDNLILHKTVISLGVRSDVAVIKSLSASACCFFFCGFLLLLHLASRGSRRPRTYRRFALHHLSKPLPLPSLPLPSLPLPFPLSFPFLPLSLPLPLPLSSLPFPPPLPAFSTVMLRPP